MMSEHSEVIEAIGRLEGRIEALERELAALRLQQPGTQYVPYPVPTYPVFPMKRYPWESPFWCGSGTAKTLPALTDVTC